MSEDSICGGEELFHQAVCEYRSGRLQNSEHLLKKVVELGDAGPDVASQYYFAEACIDLADVCAEGGAERVAEAIEYFEKGRSTGALRGARLAYLCNRLGCGYYVQGRYAEAIPALEKAIEWNKNDERSRYLLNLIRGG